MEAPKDFEKWWKKLNAIDRIFVMAEVQAEEPHVSRATASLVFNKRKFLPGADPIDWPAGVVDFVNEKIAASGSPAAPRGGRPA